MLEKCCAIVRAAAFWAALGLICAAPVPAAAFGSNLSASADSILPDPAVRTGVLPNGLRYAVMQNATPKDAVSIRLAFDVGSYDEAPDERGVAHFLEHMAFSLGRNQHEAGFEEAFAAAGVEFGRDQNAQTDAFSTVYRLDLPHGDDSALALAFTWLKGIAKGTHFTADAINHERDIILAERDARRDSNLIAYETMRHFLAPGLRSTRTDTIGTVAQLRGITADDVADFYHRWYRPENAVLVIVGDKPVDVMEAMIRSNFSDWTRPGRSPVRRLATQFDADRGLDVLILPEPHLTPEASVCRAHAAPPRGPDDVRRLRRTALSALWQNVLDQRLAALAESATPPFLSARTSLSDNLREFESVCVSLVPVDGKWEDGLRAVERELRRFQLYGPSQREFDGSVMRYRAYYRGALQSAATRKSTDLANLILEKQLRSDVVATPSENYRAFDTAVEGATPADLRDAFNRDWSGSGPLLFVLAAEPPTADAVRAAWRAGEAEPAPAAQEEEKPVVWGYSSFGPIGHVAKRESFEAPDFVRLTYANGVVLNFKKTPFEQGVVNVRVRFGAGRREIPSRDYSSALLGADFFKLGGLGRNSIQDVEREFSGWQWEATLEVGNDAFDLGGKTTTAGLRNELEILAAYVDDPGFRREADIRLPSVMDSLYREFRANPEVMLRATLSDSLAPGQNFGLPARDELMKLRMDDFARLLKPALTQAPLEITIVGDVDEATASALVADTFGALPPRTGGSRERGDTVFMHFPDGALPTLHATHDGPAEQTLVGCVWPLYVATPERRREELAILILSRVFDAALRHRVRQELGQAYSPEVGIYTPDHADQGYLGAIVMTTPHDADLVLDETQKIAARLARGEFSDADIEDARKPLVAKYAADQNTNERLLSAISGSSVTDEGIDEFRAVPELLGQITPAEVRKAAADWLTRAPMAILIAPSAATASSPSTAQRE